MFKTYAITCLFLLSARASFSQEKQVYTITRKIIVDKAVSPSLYGSFIELGFGRSDNLWAQLLYNRDFEEDKPVLGGDWLVYDHADHTEENWWHSGYEECQWYLQKDPTDNLSSFRKVSDNYWPSAHGKTFIHLENKSPDHPIYFAQDSIYVRKNIGYRFSGLFSTGSYFSADKYTGQPVEATIGIYREKDFSHPLAEEKITINTHQFNHFETDFPPVGYEGPVSFAISIAPGKTLSFDLLSLMPDDNRDGWKSEVVDMMKNQVPAGIIRFPGGCFASLYNWRDGIGNRDQRPVNYESWWGNVLVNDIGTVEFVDLCRMIHAEPFLTVPVMFGTEENAKDWVDFCNNPDNEWRNKTGHPQPLNVKYWELDNEPYRRFDAITFAKRCVEFTKAMKRADPSIKVVMGNYWVFHKKFREMLAIAGPYIDLITNRGGTVPELAGDLLVLAAYNKEHHTHIRLCNTEFRAPLTRSAPGTDGLNRPADDDGDKASMFNKEARWAYGMSVLDQYLQYQSMGGAFAFANFTNYSDGWGENLINVAKEGPFLSAAGRAMEFLDKLTVAYPLYIENKNADPAIELQAAWNKSKTECTLILLNFSNTEKEINIDLSPLGKTFAPQQKQYTVSASKMTDYNAPGHTDSIHPEEGRTHISGTRFSLRAGPNSATAIVFAEKPGA